MKNSLKKAASLIALGAVAVSAVSVNAFAEGSKFSPDGGYTAEQIAASAVKPKLSASKIVLTPAQVKEMGNKVSVEITVADADMAYAATGIHLYYSKDMDIVKNKLGKPDVKWGGATEYLTTKPADEDPTAADFDMKGVFVCTSGDGNNGQDGLLCTLTFELPEVEGGEVFPIDILYRSNATNEDLFVNTEKDEAGKIMQAYTFTQGVFNADFNNNFAASDDDAALCEALKSIDGAMDGYIAIVDAPKPTEAPEEPTEEPTEETTEEPTEATTEAPTEATTAPATTKKPVTSGSKATTKKATTAAPKTTGKKDDSPKTGVTGVGVAVAGLAAAAATAFVLRKKED